MIPVRLCCMARHNGPVCPDGTVMCAICFDKFTGNQLYTDKNGTTHDICKPCHKQDQELLVEKLLRAATEPLDNNQGGG